MEAGEATDVRGSGSGVLIEARSGDVSYSSSSRSCDAVAEGENGTAEESRRLLACGDGVTERLPFSGEVSYIVKYAKSSCRKSKKKN